jgi:hypothetical protein
VANGVAEIQNFSKAFLPFIPRYDVGLDLNARDDEGDHAVTPRPAGRQQTGSSADDRIKIRLVGNYAMLNCLCKTRTKLPKWKCVKDLRVRNYCGWWVKNAHQILAGGRIHSGLAADGSVDHGQQSGRNLNDWDPPHEGRRDKPCQITNDATAEGENRRVTTVAVRKQLVGQSSPGLPALVPFASIYCEGMARAARELPLDLISVQRADVGVSDKSVFMGRRNAGTDTPDARKEATGNPDGAAPKLDFVLTLARTRGYQVTSPIPVRTFATRASMNSKSERRLR